MNQQQSTHNEVMDRLHDSKKFYKHGEPRKEPYYFDYVLSHVALNGLYLDFGTGSSQAVSQFFIKRIEHPVYAFDWFRGLPEPWDEGHGIVHKAGTFSASWKTKEEAKETLEKRHKNLTVIPGRFEDTVEPFFSERNEPIAFAHIDCDLYKSTDIVLRAIERLIAKGTVIAFDEFYGYPNYAEHEYKAFMELIERTGFEYRFIAHVANARQASIIIE